MTIFFHMKKVLLVCVKSFDITDYFGGKLDNDGKRTIIMWS